MLDESLDAPDGVQQNILTLGRWLMSNGHQVHYLVGQSRPIDSLNVYSLSNNVRVAFNGNRLSVPMPVSKHKVINLLEDLHLDILHIQAPYSPFLSGVILKANKHAATVATFHILPSSKFVYAANYLLSLLNMNTAKFIDLNLSVSEPAAKFAKQVYGYHSKVLANPFEYDAFYSGNEIKSPPRKTNLVKVVFLGRLVPRKGPFELLKALVVLKNKNLLNNVQVIIAGKGPLGEKLKEFTQKNDLDKHCVFTGFVAEDDKAALLQSSDLAVLPSTGGESFGISLVEAMAASKGAVIAGDNPGYRSILAPELQDHLFKPKDSHEFAEILYKFISNKGLRDEASKIQRRLVEQYDVGLIGPKLLEYYEQALQKRRKQS